MIDAPATVWIVDDDRSIRWVMEKALTRAGLNVTSFDAAEKLLAALNDSQPETIISDIRMPGMDGLELLKKIRYRSAAIPVIITTAHSDLDSAVSAYQSGAFEYVPKPFDVDELASVTHRAIRSFREKNHDPEAVDEPFSTEIIGEAPAMQEVFRAIGRLSHSHITVLINGESGTGKELVARALHRHSPRRDRPFIALNMAAIPRDLIESELFGHEKGAFSGATQRRIGRFEQADGGTLFLDEIGDMPAEAQTRLLRVLADGEFYRVGGHTSVRVNVRIIGATHQDLESLVQQGAFREDLFHRLNVIRVHLPRLAERREDIPALIRFFFQKAAGEMDIERKTLSKDAEEYLTTLDWPGNVRQLENTCRWLTVMAPGREVHLSDLPPELREYQSSNTGTAANSWQQLLARWSSEWLARGNSDLLAVAQPAFEQTLIECALNHTGGRKGDAATLLGWGRNTLTRKMAELEMNDEDKD